MENVSTDILFYILTFCSIRDVCNLSIASKNQSKKCSSDLCWKLLGLRDHPKICIKNKKDYIHGNPYHVSQEEIVYELSDNNNNWIRKWYNKQSLNKNGVIDDRYKAYVVSIIKDMIRVKHYRKLSDMYRDIESSDWRLCIDKIIDDLLTRTEEENKEMKEMNEFGNCYYKFGRIY